MAKNQRLRLVIIGVILAVAISMMGTMPKEAVASVEGLPCETNDDCPCWGTIDENNQSRGIGTARCIDNACNIDLCFDLEPIGVWVKDNPFHWLRTNPLVTIVLVGLTLLVIFWPKV